MLQQWNLIIKTTHRTGLKTGLKSGVVLFLRPLTPKNAVLVLLESGLYFEVVLILRSGFTGLPKVIGLFIHLEVGMWQ